MHPSELHKAKDTNLQLSLEAMKEAAKEARKIAIQTDTAIILCKDHHLIRITAEELKQASNQYLLDRVSIK
jgi:hypothetical protein